MALISLTNLASSKPIPSSHQKDQYEDLVDFVFDNLVNVRIYDGIIPQSRILDKYSKKVNNNSAAFINNSQSHKGPKKLSYGQLEPSYSSSDLEWYNELNKMNFNLTSQYPYNRMLMYSFSDVGDMGKNFILAKNVFYRWFGRM